MKNATLKGLQRRAARNGDDAETRGERRAAQFHPRQSAGDAAKPLTGVSRRSALQFTLAFASGG